MLSAAALSNARTIDALRINSSLFSDPRQGACFKQPCCAVNLMYPGRRRWETPVSTTAYVQSNPAGRESERFRQRDLR